MTTPSNNSVRAGKVLKTNNLTVADALSSFSCPVGQKQHVQLIRPYAAFSAKAYSTAAPLPIGIAYIASIIEKAGYGVDVIDGVGEDIMRIKESPCGQFMHQGMSLESIIARIKPNSSIVGISMMFSQNWLQYRELANAVRKAYPEVIIVAGGEHITALTEFSLRDCPAIDYAVVGEGELTIVEMIHRIATGEGVKDLNGVCFLDNKGEYIDNGLGRRVSDFQSLPWPAWHLFPVENYFSGMWSMGIAYGRNMLILATRGCPYQCTFCSSPSMWTTRYMMRDPADVVDEIEFLIEKYGCNSFDFADLTAIVKKEWVWAFCDEMERRNVSIVWQLPSGTRSEALDEETVARLYKSGCRFLVYAPESGSRETLEVIKKKVNPDNMRRSIRYAAKVGHTIKLCMIIGFPHERRKHIYQTIAYALRMAWNGVNDCNISPYCPYPGSELFNQLKSEEVIQELDDDYFASLLGQFDFTNTKNYCPKVPGWEVALYRFIGMAGFYGLSYVFYPRRIFRLFVFWRDEEFKPGSLFEQRVYDFIARRRLNN